MQPVLDAPLVLCTGSPYYMDRNNHRDRTTIIVFSDLRWPQKLGKNGIEMLIFVVISPSNQNDNTNQDAMEIFLTDCFCNEELAADQDINLGPIESTTSMVVSDRRSRCCSSFVICPSSLFQLSGFQTKKIWMRMRMAMMKSTMVSMRMPLSTITIHWRQGGSGGCIKCIGPNRTWFCSKSGCGWYSSHIFLPRSTSMPNITLAIVSHGS